jgi:hypothetical protein
MHTVLPLVYTMMQSLTRCYLKRQWMCGYGASARSVVVDGVCSLCVSPTLHRIISGLTGVWSRECSGMAGCG